MSPFHVIIEIMSHLEDKIIAYYFKDQESLKSYIDTKHPTLICGYSVVVNSTLVDSWGEVTDHVYIVSKTVLMA